MRRTCLRPWVFVLFCGIFSVTLIINILSIFDWEKDNIEISNIEKEIEKIVDVVEVEDDGEIVNPPAVEMIESDYWYYVKVPFYDIDFTSLIEKNSDTIGFINVRGTNINYPIVQTNNNDYYLNHAFDKSKNDAGWIYLDYRNSKDFSNFNSIIYGHGRLNKTMFGSLKNVLNKSWQNNKDNYVINISTPTTNYVYQIFSLYTIMSETYYIRTIWKNDDNREDWINTINERDISPSTSSANIDDKIITLSTCLNDDGERIVVHAKLIKQQNKETG